MICPECRDGKPWNCTGWTLNDADELVDCDQAAELNTTGGEPAGSTRGYDRCHITDGCGGDEACAYLCPKSKVHQFCSQEGDAQ